MLSKHLIWSVTKAPFLVLSRAIDLVCKGMNAGKIFLLVCFGYLLGYLLRYGIAYLLGATPAFLLPNTTKITKESYFYPFFSLVLSMLIFYPGTFPYLFAGWFFVQIYYLQTRYLLVILCFDALFTWFCWHFFFFYCTEYRHLKRTQNASSSPRVGLRESQEPITVNPYPLPAPISKLANYLLQIMVP